MFLQSTRATAPPCCSTLVCEAHRRRAGRSTQGRVNPATGVRSGPISGAGAGGSRHLRHGKYAFGVCCSRCWRAGRTSQRAVRAAATALHESRRAARRRLQRSATRRAFVRALEKRQPILRRLRRVIDEGDRAFAGVDERQGARAVRRVVERAVITPSKATLVEVHAVTEPIAMSAVVSGSGSNRGAKRGYLVTLVAGFLVLFGVGYAGELRWKLVEWFRSMGWGAPVVALVTVAAAIMLPRIAIAARTKPGFGPLALAVALAPAALSLPSALTGWHVVTTTAEKLDPGRYCENLHAAIRGLSLHFAAGLELDPVPRLFCSWVRPLSSCASSWRGLRSPSGEKPWAPRALGFASPAWCCCPLPSRQPWHVDGHSPP